VRYTTRRKRPFWITTGTCEVTGTSSSLKVPSTALWVLTMGAPPSGWLQVSHCTPAPSDGSE
jgi:hypothetical protein